MGKILIRKAQGTMGMGTGSDLRIYNPRSESSTMFRHNHEDEDSVHSPEDGKYRDERTAKKKKEREDRAAELKNIKHIPIKTTDLHEDENVDEDLEPTKFDRELEPSLMTGTHGNFGAMTSMANQARGPGFAGGHAFAMGEAMDIAFQLLKGGGGSIRGAGNSGADAIYHYPHELDYDAMSDYMQDNPDSTLGSLVSPYLLGNFTPNTYTPPPSHQSERPTQFQSTVSAPFPQTEGQIQGAQNLIEGEFPTKIGSTTRPHYDNLNNAVRVLSRGLRGNQAFSFKPEAKLKLRSGKRGRGRSRGMQNLKLRSLLNTPVSANMAEMEMPQQGIPIAAGEPMEIAFQLLKRQTTLPGYDREHVEEMVSPENSNIWIAAKPGNEEISSEQSSNLSDAMLRELATLNRNHGPFSITSATGNSGEWGVEPSFMLTGVSEKTLPHIHELADRFGQQSIAISDADSEAARFETPQGNVTDEFTSMGFNPNAEYSTDFPTGQRLEFKKSVMVLKRDERLGFVGRKPKRAKGAKARKDYRERSRHWRPSTGEFKRPPGGMTPSSATGRRAKSRMRGIKSGKKTGLSRAHLAVEMSHRGVKTKQPKSKDPRAYRQYMGQQEARKRLGNVRTVHATPARFGARSYRAGPTGAGMLQSQLPGQAAAARQSAMRRIRPPRIPSVRMPSVPNISGGAPPSPPMSVMGQGGGQVGVGMPKLPTATVQGAGPGMVMTGKVGVGSDLQKRGLSYYDMAELRQLVNDARRAMKRKETKKKGKGDRDTSGAGSNLPRHNNAPSKETTNPTGGTEDLKNDARTFGTNPLHHLTGRGGRTP